MSTDDAAAAASVVRIESTHATAEEIAAVVAVLCSLGSGSSEPEPARSQWAGRARAGWRSSALPGSRFVERSR
ncbi:acyl-CoA carboxylase subunit epsilon [Yimella sp. cx-51]|uniref:acyl-CoA carboxylase subunit epsilon n=1 Tax=Yimella sp. cx-51 TaxID=2770551 RepID=UPI00165D66E5|nr:acyl-CoA carboxylase subunit epsilon [Yimella sp. cx-51]MBC9958128.1 acyl-CoA carboxylase subunit epsilon [Yimella sp. cx-51]MBD2759016.1 acyl-CoA carboxylase subunit epsilon [Yimella sp. cx-573]QTH38833.1 acyl-CoA carboxylase subunit epsilon [Yimella sp. cx-51]